MNKVKSLAVAIIGIVFLTVSVQAQDVQTTSTNRRDMSSMLTYSIWNGGYEKPVCEIVIGYVNKSWICTYPTGTQREDFFGDSEDQFFHGMQIGGLYTPSFDWGLGLRTGLFFEFYTSRSQWIRDFCNHFSEVDMYIPLHVSYRLPLTEDCAFNIFGGVGFQWAMDGRFYKYAGTYWPWGRRPMPVYETAKMEYGNGWPKRVNWQAEVGLNFRYKMIALSFTYSFGLVDQEIQNTFDDGKTYITAHPSRQDKMQASLSFVF